MENFNALLTLSEIKTLYSKKPVGICPLYKGSIGVTKRNEATGNPVIIPAYKSLEKLEIKFSPKQAGTGNPSPENVRPISGWDSVKITVSKGDESHDYDVTFPETIYGGTVDAVTGVGSKEWFNVILTGNERWGTWDVNQPNSFYTDIEGHKNLANNAINVFCSNFLYDIEDSRYALYHFFSQNPGAYPDRVRLCFTFDETVTNIELAKQWIAAQASAGTPVQVAYKLATPKPFEISKISIPSLGSENTFFTNGENMDIIYKERSFWG